MGHADARHIKGTEMPNVTFSSPLLYKDLTVYAIAGDTSTVLAIAEANKVPIPHDCRNGECGSCLIEVVTLSGKTMGSLLTENEKTQLKSIGKITPEEIRKAEVEDIAPKFRLACQYVVRDQDILVKFTGEPGGALGSAKAAGAPTVGAPVAGIGLARQTRVNETRDYCSEPR